MSGRYPRLAHTLFLVAGFMTIPPGRGLQALETIVSSSTTAISAVHGVGGFAWSAIMRSQARSTNPLFAEFMPEQREEKLAQSSDKGHALEAVKPEQNIMQEVLQILQSVLGSTVDNDQPLMEVTLHLTLHFLLLVF